MSFFRSIDHVLWGYLRVNHYLFVVRNTFNVEVWKIMHTQLILVFVSWLRALLGIRILISSFIMMRIVWHGMAYSTLDSFQLSILEGLWYLTTGWEVFFSATRKCHSEAICLAVDCDNCRRAFSLKSLISSEALMLGYNFIPCPTWKRSSRT